MPVSQIFQATLKSVEKVKTVTIITIVALSTNILLNAIFIYGWFGIPKMGIFGVALATLIARILEAVLCVTYASTRKDVSFNLGCFFRFDKILTKDFYKYSLPALGNELVWGTAFSVYSVILGHLGEDIVAANSVVNVVKNLATVLCFGMSYGGAIILGKQMGAGNLDVAERNATAIITSHSLRELEDTCDQLALLHQGGLVFEQEIQDLKTTLFKVQIAFTDDYSAERFDIIDVLHFSKRGSVSNLIVRGDKEETLDTLKHLSPTLLEVLPLTLEEVFTFELQALGYNFDAVLEEISHE
jgi:hypothetical protein